jgi:DNA-directed RNA polymerase subunit RPC12/RpoP
LVSQDEKLFDHCPHCGRALSPWEQVLLNVDRALMCKGCWYRILLDAFDKPVIKENPSLESGDKT